MQLTEKQEKWLQMLESGDYKQGTGRLGCVVNGDKQYCCLGIASICLNRHIWNENRLLDQDIHGANLSVESQQILGLHNQVGMILRDRFTDSQKEMIEERRTRGSEECDSLIDLNDSIFTFKELAQFIRINPTVVFVE